MCYDDRSRPPKPPRARTAAKGKDIELVAKDGNRFAAYIAEGDHSSKAQVLIYPDVRGLHQFYKDLALRFAEVGINALAIDYFGRTAGLGPRDETFDYHSHVEQLTAENVFTDTRAALDYLQQNFGFDQKTFILGFCMGGSLTLLSGTQDFKLAGLVAFYAGFKRVFPGKGTALEEAHKIRFPVLGLFGGADQNIPVSQVEQLDLELDKTKVDHEIVIYKEAPHSFFDRKQKEFAQASTDAWKRILGFITNYSKSPLV